MMKCAPPGRIEADHLSYYVQFRDHLHELFVVRSKFFLTTNRSQSFDEGLSITGHGCVADNEGIDNGPGEGMFGAGLKEPRSEIRTNATQPHSREAFS